MTPVALPKRDVEAAATVLQRAGQRVSGDRWCREGIARNRRGKVCPSVSDDAVRWSLLGAIHAELERKGYGHHKEDRVYALVLGALEAAQPSWRVWHEQEGRKARDATALANRAAKTLNKGRVGQKTEKEQP